MARADDAGKRVATNVHLDREVWERLRRIAFERQMAEGRRVTMADLLNEAAAEWLERRAKDAAK